jgi:hypothetical protein
MTELRDIEIVTSALEALGFRLVGSGSRWGDSGSADFRNGHRTLTVEKDRGQWMLTGEPREALERAGLGGMFEQTGPFVEALVGYVRQTREA